MTPEANSPRLWNDIAREFCDDLVRAQGTEGDRRLLLKNGGTALLTPGPDCDGHPGPNVWRLCAGDTLEFLPEGAS